MCVNYSDSIYRRISINHSGVLSRRKRETASGQMAKKSPLQLRSVGRSLLLLLSSSSPPESICVLRKFRFLGPKGSEELGREKKTHPPTRHRSYAYVTQGCQKQIWPTRVFLQKAMYFRIINLQYEGSSWIEFKMPY